MNISLKSFFLLLLFAQTSLFAAAGEFSLSKPSRNRSKNTLYQPLVMPEQNQLKISCLEIKTEATLPKGTKFISVELQSLNSPIMNKKDLVRIARAMIADSDLNHFIVILPHKFSGKTAAIKSFITKNIFKIFKKANTQSTSPKPALMILFRIQEKEADELTDMLLALSIK